MLQKSVLDGQDSLTHYARMKLHATQTYAVNSRRHFLTFQTEHER